MPEHRLAPSDSLAVNRAAARAIPASMAIRLLHEIRGDGPYWRTVAEARVYEPDEIQVNRHGAVSVLTDSGRWLGVRPEEMEWLDG